MQISPRRRLAAPLALGALMLAPAAAHATRVTLRVEGATRTLVPSRQVTLPAGPVGLPGRPACPGASALGALDAATTWSGSYSAGLGYFVTTIAGERHPGSPDYFSFWFRNREASRGVCQTHPRDGDQLLFFVSRYPSKRPIEPLELRAPRTVRSGRTFTVVVRKWSAQGVPSRVPGALVSFGRGHVRADRHGAARITAGRSCSLAFTATASAGWGPTAARRSCRLALRATAPGLVRSETDVVRVAP